jgi:hypothetical protein
MTDLAVGRLRSDIVRRVIKRACQFNIPRQQRFDLYQGGRLRQLGEEVTQIEGSRPFAFAVSIKL